MNRSCTSVQGNSALQAGNQPINIYTPLREINILNHANGTDFNLSCPPTQQTFHGNTIPWLNLWKPRLDFRRYNCVLSWIPTVPVTPAHERLVLVLTTAKHCTNDPVVHRLSLSA
jgi:hypothetical protein